MNYQSVPYILCQQVRQGIRILRVFGDYPVPVLPDSILGSPLTELGPYCFSASEKKFPEDAFLWVRLQDGREIRTSLSEESNLPPALCGSFVEDVRLPSGIRTLHNGAFYNCRQLRKLSCGPDISAIGSDVFTNCRKLKDLEIRSADHLPTGLPLLLERLPDDLRVRFTEGGLLFFPEYYEWLDEVSPAHLFSRSINGEGYRMRKCFRDRILDYSKYDQCFASALRTESDQTLCKIALARLRHPAGLSQEARAAYLSAIGERAESCLKLAASMKDTHLLRFIFREADPSSDLLSRIYNQAGEEGWGEGAALLTEEIHQRYRKPSYDFDMDF